jgi:hypothetical protein
VCGVKNKLNYAEFNDLICKYDKIGLTETKTDDCDSLQIPGFVTALNNQRKLTNTRLDNMLILSNTMLKHVLLFLKKLQIPLNTK